MLTRQVRVGWRLRGALLASVGWACGSASADIAGVPVHGFIDLGYANTTQQGGPEGTSGFKLGNLDVFLTPNISERIKGLAEVVFEFDDWYGDGQMVADVERMQVGYTVSDTLTVWAGRFHTPYGFWNTAFHHGAFLQTTTERPVFLSFEDHGGILPAHTIGLWATGKRRQPGGAFTYDLYLGNGSRIIVDHGAPADARSGVLDPNLGGDSNRNKALGTRLGYQFTRGALDGLWVGVHAFSERIDSYLGAGGKFSGESSVGVLGAFADYEPGDWQWIAEYYHFSNQDLSGGGAKHSSYAAYVQGGYTLEGRFTPYARYEKSSFDQQDPYFASLEGGRSYDRKALGLRFDIDPAAALKLEGWVQDASRDAGQKFTEVRLSLAVRF